MSILKKFQDLNNFKDKKKFYKIFFGNTHIGYTHKKIAEQFLSLDIPVRIINGKLYILETTTRKANLLMNKIGNFLLNKKFIQSLTGEPFPCVKNLGAKEYFSLDRSLVEMLGIKGYGVHLIVYIKKKNQIKLWIPKRSNIKKVAPNKLDNTVAGGVSSKENIYEALFREAYEEAGIKKHLIKKSKLTGTLRYEWRNKKYSLRRDILYLFELEVDENFIPSCQDGEVDNYKLMDWQDVLRDIEGTDSFKKNSALVTIIFLIRKGLITPQNESNYEAINNFIN